jgi:hypothetical protein
VVKCHRENAGFACLLCYRFREKDTLLESVNGLIRHLWQRHEAQEIEDDEDIKEVSASKNTVMQRKESAKESVAA